MCYVRAWPPLPAQRYALQRGLARSQQWHHQLRQFFVCHAHRVPVHHYGGLDGCSLLGNLCLKRHFWQRLYHTDFVQFLQVFKVICILSESLPSNDRFMLLKPNIFRTLSETLRLLQIKSQTAQYISVKLRIQSLCSCRQKHFQTEVPKPIPQRLLESYNNI